MPITKNRKAKLIQVANQRQEGVIVLEDIHDPHNAAAVLRTCDGFGFQKVCFIFEKETQFNPKKVGKATSSSANKWLDFEVFTSTEKCFKKLKRQGFEIYATVLDQKAKPLFKTKFKKAKIALALGNEHAGLSKKAMDLADFKVYLPMQGFVQSLNLSVTAAIFMYEIFRQRQGNKKYNLPKKESLKLLKNWLGK